jgi:hypothetical protein
MRSLKAAARRAGALYLLFSIVAVIGEFFFPDFVVPGDAAATARTITARELAYRLSLLTGLVTHVLFLVLVVALYELLRDVNRKRAMLMLVFVVVGVALALGNLIPKAAPLILLAGADYLTVFTAAQLDALALGALRLHAGGATLTVAFWGLWLLPFGLLVIRSGFLPRILGVLLLVAGFAYLTTSITSLVLPEHRQVVSRIMMPLYFGELPIIFWLLLKGAGAPAGSRGSERRTDGERQAG